MMTIELNEVEADAHTQAELFFATVDDFAAARKVSPLTMLFVAAIIVQSCRDQMVGNPDDDKMRLQQFVRIWTRFIDYLGEEEIRRGIHIGDWK